MPDVWDHFKIHLDPRLSANHKPCTSLHELLRFVGVLPAWDFSGCRVWNGDWSFQDDPCLGRPRHGLLGCKFTTAVPISCA